MKDLTAIMDKLHVLAEGRSYYPSPSAWEDQVLYFLMLDRFSDGLETNYLDNEGMLVTRPGTPLYDASAQDNAGVDWQQAGEKFCGGSLKGLQSKLGYLQRLGVTAVWISPIFKQVPSQESYHGYGIQDFLAIEPRFGTKEDLKALVESAHQLGIYVILDIILNHAGDVFEYSEPNPVWDGSKRPVRGFRDAQGYPTISFSQNPSTHPDEAVWPVELQNPATFTQKGSIRNWDYYPEYLEGDFMSLKDIDLGTGEANANVDHFQPSPALRHLADCYKYWMGYADIDGYRIDTVKHMPVGVTRHFASVIHEFGQVLGKDRFYLIGEITGGREHAFKTMELTGLNAALGIDEVQEKLEGAAKGNMPPESFFELFRNSEVVGRGTHTWFRNRIVTMFDDHDQVRRGQHKARFCSWGNGPDLVLNALALNVLTLGVPCIYYGSEQYFDGHGAHDKYLRECMFGGRFGAFGSQDHHFFNETSNVVVRELRKILHLRSEHLALRRGRQYLREISEHGDGFGYPRQIGPGWIRSVVAWSRIHSGQEILIAINTDTAHATSAWVVVDMVSEESWELLYPPLDGLVETSALSSSIKSGRRCIYLTVPPAGLMIYKRR